MLRIPLATLENSEYQTWLEQTRLKLEAGRQAADRGELLDVDDVIEQLNAKIAAARSTQLGYAIANPIYKIH